MSRYIDADALLETIQQHDYLLATRNGSIDNGMFTIGIKQAIDEQPTADVVPVVHGHFDYDDELQEYICSECGHCTAGYFDMEDAPITDAESKKIIGWALRKPNYCKHCGAKMDEVTDNAV